MKLFSRDKMTHKFTTKGLCTALNNEQSHTIQSATKVPDITDVKKLNEKTYGHIYVQKFKRENLRTLYVQKMNGKQTCYT